MLSEFCDFLKFYSIIAVLSYEKRFFFFTILVIDKIRYLNITSRNMRDILTFWLYVMRISLINLQINISIAFGGQHN